VHKFRTCCRRLVVEKWQLICNVIWAMVHLAFSHFMFLCFSLFTSCVVVQFLYKKGKYLRICIIIYCHFTQCWYTNVAVCKTLLFALCMTYIKAVGFWIYLYICILESSFLLLNTFCRCIFIVLELVFIGFIWLFYHCYELAWLVW